MNFLTYIKSVKCITHTYIINFSDKKNEKLPQSIRVRYYYLEYINNDDDIEKKFSVLIGMVKLEDSIMTDTEYIPIKSLDEHNRISPRTYGYGSYMNCNIKVKQRYKIYSEVEGSHVEDDIGHIHRGELKIDTKRINYYTTLKLANRHLLNKFWKLNHDWIIKI